MGKGSDGFWAQRGGGPHSPIGQQGLRVGQPQYGVLGQAAHQGGEGQTQEGDPKSGGLRDTAAAAAAAAAASLQSCPTLYRHPNQVFQIIHLF